jgi:hypothetical protein
MFEANALDFPRLAGLSLLDWGYLKPTQLAKLITHR